MIVGMIARDCHDDLDVVAATWSSRMELYADWQEKTVAGKDFFCKLCTMLSCPPASHRTPNLIINLTVIIPG